MKPDPYTAENNC